eukprot:scpid113971/ scgid19821/ 
MIRTTAAFSHTQVYTHAHMHIRIQQHQKQKSGQSTTEQPATPKYTVKPGIISGVIFFSISQNQWFSSTKISILCNRTPNRHRYSDFACKLPLDMHARMHTWTHTHTHT